LKTRLVWLDSGDLFEVDDVLGKIRDKCQEHDWIRFEESSYESSDKAKADFQRYFGAGSLFGEGRVICMREAPSFSKWLSEMLPPPEGNVLVIVAPADKKNPIYEAAKKNKAWAVVKDSEPLTRGNSSDWVVKRAGQVGTSIEDVAASMLVDKVGMDKNHLTMELRKLAIVSNPIMAWAIEQVSFGGGEGDIRDFLNALAKPDKPTAHEIMDRLIAKGDWPMGAICDWLRKMCVAESCGGNFDDETREKVAAMRKPVKEDGKLKLDKDGEIVTTPFFANPRALYYSCKEIKSKPPGWAYALMGESRDLQLKLRTAKSPMASSTMLHVFIEKIMGGD